jgi:predicted phage terminase large subunit-like protein
MLDPSKLIKVDATSAEIISRFGLRVNAYLDFATKERETQKDDPDYSCIVAAGKDQLGRIFIVDIFAKQCAYDELARSLIGMYRAYNFRSIKGEKGGLINTFQPILTMTQRLTGVFFPLFPFKGPKSAGDKVSRSAGFQGMLNAGMICVPTNAPWLPRLESEMRAFPNGSHDDITDCCAMACNDANDLMQGEAPITQPDDETILMDEEHKRELQRRIGKMQRGESDDDTPGHDW